MSRLSFVLVGLTLLILPLIGIGLPLPIQHGVM
jgi:hypothetical protein